MRHRAHRQEWFTWLVVAGLAVLALIIGIVVGTRWEADAGLEQKTGERVIEFIFIVFMGALVGWSVSRLRQESERRAATREKESAWRDFLAKKIRSYSSNLNRVYRPLKQVRHEVRLIVGYECQRPISKVEYLRAIHQINTQQLKIEDLRNEICDFNDTRISQGSTAQLELDEAEKGLHAMRNYLDDICMEAEQLTSVLADEFQPKNVPRFRAFIVGASVKRGRGDFKSKFIEQYKFTKRHLVAAHIHAAHRHALGEGVESDGESPEYQTAGADRSFRYLPAFDPWAAEAPETPTRRVRT